MEASKDLLDGCVTLHNATSTSLKSHDHFDAVFHLNHVHPEVETKAARNQSKIRAKVAGSEMVLSSKLSSG